MRNTRTKFVTYEPDYVPGPGKYKTVYSWYQALKLCRKWGSGTQFHVCRFMRRRDGSIAFWNVENVYHYEM